MISSSKPQIEDQIKSYKPSERVCKIVRQVQILQIIGISGAGKNTVTKELLKLGNYHFIISHTTRPPRKNHGILEVDGVDYHFIDLETARYMLGNKGFVEAKFYSNNVYGTSVGEFELARNEGKIAIVDLEIQGAAEYQTITKSVYPVFIIPPDYATWMKRLQSRYQDLAELNQEELNRRKQTAARELNFVLQHDYFIPLINDDLNTTIKQADQIAHGQPLKEEDKQAAIKVIKQLLAGIADSGS